MDSLIWLSPFAHSPNGGQFSFDTDELPTAASTALDVDRCRMHSGTTDQGSWRKMMSLLSNIREQMEIITVDGACLGRVAFLSEPDQIGVSGHKELVPIKWIAWVDGSVYLTKTRQQVMVLWNSVEPKTRRLDLPEAPERQAPPLA